MAVKPFLMGELERVSQQFHLIVQRCAFLSQGEAERGRRESPLHPIFRSSRSQI